MKKVIFIYFMIPILAIGQTLTTTVNKNPVSVGEQFQVSFSADSDIEEFKAPNFNGLRVLSGPNQSSSSSVQMINGKFSQSKTISYNYYMTALNEGELEIGSAIAKSKDKKIQSKPIKLIVTKANPKSKNNLNDLDKKVFLKSHINKTKLYQGEQLIVSYKLYSRINLANIDIDDLPSLNGFWKDKIETSSKPSVENINGVNHNVWEISRMILTPQRSGVLEIDPMNATVTVQIKNNSSNRFNDPFGFFDNYQNIDKKISSSTKNIEVSPLPESPLNFSGGVGQFNIKSSLDKSTVKTNDAITYKVILSGEGNLQLIDNLPINFPNDFEVYDPELTDKTFNSKNGTSGKKILEYLIIPRYEGTYQIPSTEFIYFNSKSKKYETLKTESFNVKVIQGEENQNTYRSTEELEESKKINDIKKELRWIKKDSDLFSKWWYWLFLTLPILIVIVYYFYIKYEEKMSKDPISRKFRKSLKIAQKRLKNAHLYLTKNEKERFFEEIEKSLWLYFAHKFNVNLADLSKETISDYFSENKINQKVTTEFTQILNNCEFCRFAPASLDANKMNDIYQKATEVIIEVESELKK